MSENREETILAQSAPEPAPVPFAVHEATIAFAHETITRLWITVLALIAAIVAIVVIGVYAWLQYDYTSETVTVESAATGDANYIGANGDIYNYGEGYSQEETPNP